MAFDPFGDRETRGYLRNRLKTNDPHLIRQLEGAAFARNVPHALRFLSGIAAPDYSALKETHRILFQSVYPWAGEDRQHNAPDLAIGRGGMNDLFAHPADVCRAGRYAMAMGMDPDKIRTHPGEVFGALAYAHPFLDGNGRTILTVHTDLAARAGFHIDWSAIPKEAFLKALTDELRSPGSAMDGLVSPYIRTGTLSAEHVTSSLIKSVTAASPSPGI
ncbi:Fic/DOC family protein [Acetobacter sp.]|uniref:Fic/DOC family protein n=1 Tax=Acetobacter sp. TaxID=440 RepID=UPI0039E88240